MSEATDPPRTEGAPANGAGEAPATGAEGTTAPAAGEQQQKGDHLYLKVNPSESPVRVLIDFQLFYMA